jgi:hypothetical protein
MYLRIVFAGLVLFCASFACVHKDDDTAAKPRTFPSRFLELQERALRSSDNGWMVNRYKDTGGVHDPGDSGLFTGIFLGVATCDIVPIIAQKIADEIKRLGGLYPRHPTLPGYRLDAHLGLFWGTVHAGRRCGLKAIDPLAVALAMNADAIDLEPPFWVARAQALFEVGVELEPPPAEARGFLGTSLIVWATGVVNERAAGYRLHLGFLALDTIDAPNSKVGFCAAVKPADIPLLEHWCGRADLETWIEGFAEDVWEYRHQRAAWETPDGDCLGRPCTSPALDYLIAARVAYGDPLHGYRFVDE